MLNVAKIKAHLILQEKSYQELATHLEMTIYQISNRLNNRVSFTADEIKKTADFLGVPVDSLFGA